MRRWYHVVIGACIVAVIVVGVPALLFWSANTLLDIGVVLELDTVAAFWVPVGVVWALRGFVRAVEVA